MIPNVDSSLDLSGPLTRYPGQTELPRAGASVYYEAPSSRPVTWINMDGSVRECPRTADGWDAGPTSAATPRYDPQLLPAHLIFHFN